MPVLFPGVAETLQIRVFSAGYIELGEWWPRTDVVRGFWRLYLNEDHGVHLDLLKGRFDLPPQRLVLVPPGLNFEAGLDGSVKQLFVHFEFVGWLPEATVELVPDPVVLRPDEQRDLLARELRDELTHAQVIDPILGSRLKALIHLSIAALLSDLPADRTSNLLHMVDEHQELVGVIQYIEENLDQSLSNAHLAKIAGTSESRFIRRFREVMGQPPARYVQDRRLRRAAVMLVSTEDSISDIAERCGFANRYYFSRVFAHHMGIPPAKYRTERPHLK